MDLNMKWNDYPSDTLYLYNGEDLFKITQNTTDENLSDEDIDEGYKDSWMTDIFREKYGLYGGQWMETELISDIDYTLQGVIDRMMECDLWDDNWEIIDEDLGDKLSDCFEKYLFAKGELKRFKSEL